MLYLLYARALACHSQFRTNKCLLLNEPHPWEFHKGSHHQG